MDGSERERTSRGGAGIDASEALAGKLRTLIQLIELISCSLDTDEILREIAAAAVRLTDARCASLWVADEAARQVELRACSDAAIGAGHPSPRLAYGEGVAGWVTLHDEPIKADDLDRTPMLAREWYAAHGLRSVYALPVAYQDSVVGVLVLLAAEPFDLEIEEYEILEALIAEAGAAIRNSRLLAESERRRRTAEALAELSRLSSETLDLGTVARRVVESVRTLLGAQESALYRLVPETGDLAALALMGEREQALGPGAIFPRGTGVVGLAARERRPIATSNFADDPRIRHDPTILERLEGACVPGGPRLAAPAQGPRDRRARGLRSRRTHVPRERDSAGPGLRRSRGARAGKRAAVRRRDAAPPRGRRARGGRRPDQQLARPRRDPVAHRRRRLRADRRRRRARSPCASPAATARG